jgi:DNA-binding Xre family transcriptional regulator
MILLGLTNKMKGVRPEVLAAKTGLSKSTIENARNGQSVREITATLIAKALKCHVSDLTSKPEELVTTGEG